MALTETETEKAAAERRGSNGNSSSHEDHGLSAAKRLALADLLRDCAAQVENNEFDQAKFQDMFREMTNYVKSQGGRVTASTATATASVESSSPPAAASVTPPAAATAAAPPVVVAAPSSDTGSSSRPADPPGATGGARKVTTTTTTHVPAPPASTSSRGEKREESAISNQKKHNFFAKVKSTVKEVGHEFSNIAHTGGRGPSQAAKHATSHKNAQRVKTDLANEFGDLSVSESRSETGNPTATVKPTPNPNRRPPFQRPVNPNSTLIANGWVEQQRSSKFRKVWKEVLVSLVAGRRPGEETTLWVQREVINDTTGKTELEALHQIPVKGMQDINYIDFSHDHRFVIQVYNLSDEFVFRTLDNVEAAKSWVSTLRLTRDAVMNGVAPPRGSDLNAASNRTKHYPGTAREEDQNRAFHEEKKADSPPAANHTHNQNHPPPPQEEQQQQQPKPHTSKKLSVSDLRAIAHGHGVNTHGMEKGELQAVVAKIQQQQNHHAAGVPTPHPPSAPPPPAQKHAPPPPDVAHARSSSDFTSASSQEDRRRQEEDSLREAQRLQREEEQREAERRAQQMRMDREAAAKLAAEEREHADVGIRVAAEKQRKAQAEAEQRRRQEYLRQQEIQRQRQQQEAERQRQWQAYQQQQQQRQQWEEQQRRYQQQQQQWHAQQQQQQQKQQRPPPPGHAGYPQHPQQPHPQQRPQQQQPRPGHATPPPGAGGHPHQAPPNAQRPGAGTTGSADDAINQKWGNMANESETNSGKATITTIKHNVLVSWALQPPNYQMLRPIANLLSSVHTVFPPFSGVPAHDHFKKFKGYSMDDLCENGRPAENKLGKAIKRLRFVLHPDKLPKDLNEEQAFLCKMVWDIVSDGMEEYEKHKDDLDWLNPS